MSRDPVRVLREQGKQLRKQYPDAQAIKVMIPRKRKKNNHFRPQRESGLLALPGEPRE